MATTGQRTADDSGTDAARTSLLQSAAHDIPCAPESVTVLMGGQMGKASLVTGCGKMCGYDYVAYSLFSCGWKLRSCVPLGGANAAAPPP